MMKYLIVGLCLPTFAAMGPSLAANVSDDVYTAIRVNDLLAKFLLTTQRSEGSWRVVSHSPKFQTYFTTGFPYAGDQWISSWATGWGTMALAQAIEPSSALAAR